MKNYYFLINVLILCIVRQLLKLKNLSTYAIYRYFIHFLSFFGKTFLSLNRKNFEIFKQIAK